MSSPWDVSLTLGNDHWELKWFWFGEANSWGSWFNQSHWLRHLIRSNIWFLWLLWFPVKWLIFNWFSNAITGWPLQHKVFLLKKVIDDICFITLGEYWLGPGFETARYWTSLKKSTFSALLINDDHMSKILPLFTKWQSSLDLWIVIGTWRDLFWEFHYFLWRSFSLSPSQSNHCSSSKIKLYGTNWDLATVGIFVGFKLRSYGVYL